MLLKTILNRVHRFKSFVYQRATWGDDAQFIEVEVVPRANGRAICSGCGEARPGYDRLTQRRFEFVPLWGIPVFLLYCMRRVDCSSCGVKVESVPWVEGKSHLTKEYTYFLARWARRLSWKEVAEVFETTWDNVHRAVRAVVEWGLAHRSLQEITAIGVDEIQWRKGHKYLTLVYDISPGAKRLLWIGRDRTEKTLLGFFRMLGEERSKLIDFVCSDMWQPYLTVIAEKAGQAVHVLDRYHIMATMNKAIDHVRAAEVKRLKADGYEPILKHSRWCLLKRPKNLTERQDLKLTELLKYNLKAVRAYLLREEFQRFWDYISPAWAGKFLDGWCRKTMRSRLEPMKKVVKSLRQHRELLLNWFRARGQVSTGVVEGLNNKVKVTMRKSYGFRTEKIVTLALYHVLGALPEPESTHRFC